jgi:S1-C subfamily serine protease
LNILGEQSAIESFIQTDAAVNRGNSGGALVNTVGELVGINSAIASNTGSFAGYSFAVPANIAKKIVQDLIQYGKVQRAYLGVAFTEIDHKKADELKLSEVKGVFIASVEKDGAADRAGIRKEDIILEIGKAPTNSISELKEVIAQYSPGDKTTVKILRNNKVIYLDVEFLSKLGNTEVLKKEDINVNALLSGSFETLSKKECDSFGIPGGIRLVAVHDGILKRSGIKEGYVITSVNRKPVHSVQDLNQILSDDQTGYVALEGFYKNTNSRYFYTIPLQ